VLEKTDSQREQTLWRGADYTTEHGIEHGTFRRPASLIAWKPKIQDARIRAAIFGNWAITLRFNTLAEARFIAVT